MSRLSDRRDRELRSSAGSPDGVVVDVGPGPLGVLARVRPGDHAVASDGVRLPFADRSADLVLCVDLLQTLDGHRPLIREMARITSGRCVVSVPWEPWARLGALARGHDLRRLGRDPSHVQAFTPKRLVRALRRGFRDVELHPCLPWLVAECRGPRA